MPELNDFFSCFHFSPSRVGQLGQALSNSLLNKLILLFGMRIIQSWIDFRIAREIGTHLSSRIVVITTEYRWAYSISQISYLPCTRTCSLGLFRIFEFWYSLCIFNISQSSTSSKIRNQFQKSVYVPILRSDWLKIQYINRAISRFLVEDFWQMSDMKLMNLIVEYIV